MLIKVAKFQLAKYHYNEKNLPLLKEEEKQNEDKLDFAKIQKYLFIWYE